MEGDIHLKVRIAEYKTATNPHILSCIGLGSCIGICLYDPTSRIGGLAHVLLPDSTQIKNDGTKPAKFADTAVAATMEEMLRQGAKRAEIRAKLVGGATMFSMGDADEFLKIGKGNVDAARKTLSKLGIRLVAEDTGGDYGRTIEFHIDTGKVLVKSKVCVTEL